MLPLAHPLDIDVDISTHRLCYCLPCYCPSLWYLWTVPACALGAGTYEEVCAFAREKFGAAFTLFDPLSVNGPSTHPVYQWLKANNPDDGKRIEWNFAKFLVDGNGAVVRRYKPGVLPEMIEGDVAALVADRPLPKRVKPQLGAV